MALNRPNHRPPKRRYIEASDLNNDKFYSIYEVADLLKLHHSTIRRMIKAGELPATKCGRVWRISKEALQKFTSM